MMFLLVILISVLLAYVLTALFNWFDDRPDKNCMCGQRDNVLFRHRADGCTPWSELP